MSEFGKGFVYCLVLWAKHIENEMVGKQIIDEKPNYSLWINGASDHLYEFNWPENLPNELKEKCEVLKELALDWGHGTKMMNEMPKETFDSLVDLTKEIAMGIDKWLGAEVEKGDWE